jgi:hypothetical protein
MLKVWMLKVKPKVSLQAQTAIKIRIPKLLRPFDLYVALRPYQTAPLNAVRFGH